MPTNPLDSVHPLLKTRLELVYAAIAVLGYPMRPTEGLRTVERQQALFAQGRTKPGKKVTECDGVVKRSNHQARVGETFGRAVDSCFVGLNPYLEGHPLFEQIWAAYGACAEAQGLSWGGRWKSKDRPHVELV